MNKYQQIKNYVDDHFKYYAFYPFDIVLNMDTEEEETLSYEEYWHILKNLIMEKSYAIQKIRPI